MPSANVSAIQPTSPDWTERARTLGQHFAARTASHDREGSFVTENFEELRAAGFMSSGIGTDLGGGGASYSELCSLLRELAKHCPSTALALSMHTHLVAASVFKRRNGAPEEPLQQRIVDSRISLVSTGATDWIDSNGSMEKVDGGFRYSGRKVFASGAPVATMMVTSGRYEDPDAGARVLHFAVPFEAEGVEIQDDWDTLGMRGTGSHSVTLDRVFVADDKIALNRPAGEWHPVWNVVLTVALPLIMSVYRGIAEQAATVARSRRSEANYLPALVGELENQLTLTQMTVDNMVALVDDYQFAPSLELANAMLIRKTLAAEAAQATVRKAAEIAGGSSFFRSSKGLGVEQMVRDIQAAGFHPLPRPRQLEFTGRLSLGQSPV